MVSRILFVVLVFIDLVILALVLDILAGTPSELVGTFLILVAAASFYGGGGMLVNSMSGRTLVPLGGPLLLPGRPSLEVAPIRS